MNSRRLISIVIPARRGDFLEAALHSAFSQTHDDIEIVVCDDAADDAVQHTVERLRPHSPWPLRYLRNETPLGEIPTVVRGVRESSGAYVKFLHDQDLLHPDCTRLLFEHLEASPEVTLASSRRSLIDEQGQPLPDTKESAFPFNHNAIFSGVELASFLGQFPVDLIGGLSCVMARRADLLTFGDDLMSLNGPPIEPFAELALYLKLLRRGDLMMLEQALSFIRDNGEPGHKAPRATEPSRSAYARRVSDLGWSRGFDERRTVSVSTLDNRTQWHDVDLLSWFDGCFTVESKTGVNHWLQRRVVNPIQRQLIDDRINAGSAGSALLLVVLDTDTQTRKVMNTLDSILAHQPVSQDLSVVVLSLSPPPADFLPDAHLQWKTSSSGQWVTVLNQLIEGRACDWFMVAEAGAIFTAHGIARVRLALPQHPHCVALFGDEMHRALDGTQQPAFRPDFNLDYLLSYPAALSRHWIVHRQTFIALGGFDTNVPDAIDLDLILRLIENEGVAELHHIAEPLLICDEPRHETNEDEIRALSRHLQARGYVDSQIFQTAPGQYQVRYNHADQPLVSILIPTKDQLGILSRCVESVLEKTRYDNYEIIIIDNNSGEADALEWLAGVEAMQSEKVRVLRHPFPFNYSEINNTAAQYARGEYLVLLNNDTAVLHPEWLDNLLNHALRPEVGVVGAKLYFPNASIQHAGVVLGVASPALHVFLGAGQENAGYMQRLQVDQDYSVVTAACLMVRKSLYEEVGGLDEVNFKVSYNDVDLCLKIREAGYLVVWTPHVRLLHESSVSQINVDSTAFLQKIERFQGEQLAMYRKWLPVMANDPAYNANFALTGNGFEIESNTDLTWRPLPWRPLPLVLVQRAQRWESSDHRLTTPLNALQQQVLIDGASSLRLVSIVETERLRPAAIVFQQLFSDTDLKTVETLKSLSPALRVLDLDRLPKAGVTDPALLNSLEWVDRVTVSVPTLATALSGLHADIRVVADYLPVEWKKNLNAQRQPGAKLRVGWVSDDPTLDIDLLGCVMEALADEVDFVVMGECPAPIRTHVRELHPHVATAQLPAAMAAMKLDIALLPQLDNHLQLGQSLTQVLRFGACGYAVIASDALGDDGALPVMRLRNDADEWIATLRRLIADADARVSLADALQHETLSHWVLDEHRLNTWRDAWLP